MKLNKKKIKMLMIYHDIKSDRVLAERLGKHTFVVNRWINGVHLPRKKDLKALATLLCTTEQEILSE